MSVARVSLEYVRTKRLLQQNTEVRKVITRVEPEPDNVCQWTVEMVGPSGTPYEDGTFKLTIHFTDNFPHQAPGVFFDTLIWHSNVCPISGRVCVNLLKEKW